MYARPATLEKSASNPLIEETPAPPQDELRDHGFINNSVAPADPALSSLPANVGSEVTSIPAITKLILILLLNFISIVI